MLHWQPPLQLIICPPPPPPLPAAVMRAAQIVDRANRWAELLGAQGSVAYVYANATISLASLLSTYPGPIMQILVRGVRGLSRLWRWEGAQVRMVCVLLLTPIRAAHPLLLPSLKITIIPQVQYPDPHFKKRHHKRRIIQPNVIEAATQLLAPGATVLLQSDVLEVAESMRDAFERHGGAAFRLAEQHGEGSVWFAAQPAAAEEAAAPAASTGATAEAAAAAAASTASTDAEAGSSYEEGGGEGAGGSGDEEEEEEAFESQWAALGWLQVNPLGVPTEREFYVQQSGDPCYRVLLEKV